MKPTYVAIAAITIDGKITKNDLGSDWTSPEDKDFMRAELDQCDVIIVGQKTYQQYEDRLSIRNCVVLTRRVTTPEQKNQNCLYFNPSTPEELKEFIKDKKYQRVCVLGGEKIYSYCLENDLLDEIFLTVEPLVFGSGLAMFDTKLKEIVKFKLLSTKKLNDNGTMVLHYQRIKI